jgi:hypothetical protein
VKSWPNEVYKTKFKMLVKKTIIFSLALLSLIAVSCGNRTHKESANSASNLSDTGKAIISFNEYEHDFGKIAEGEKVGYTFIFENKGKGDLVIFSALTTCGCTVPKYDSKPIPPGGKGSIEVVFDTTDRNGMQTKTISVRTNASVPVVILKITTDVVKTIN